MSTARQAPGSARNEVALTGRVSSAPLERVLPSGDRVVCFRLVMERSRSPMTAKSRQASDWVDCAAWGGRTRRTAGSWRIGDEVEVSGALRRRFYHDGSGKTTRVEVEVLAARRLVRARGSAKRP
jgi:single-strand DNA-binding protein